MKSDKSNTNKLKVRHIICEDGLRRELVEKSEVEKLIAEQVREARQCPNTVDRLEVIDSTGRAYVKGSIYGSPVKVELSYQDDDRTLKVFVEELEKEDRE